MSRAKRKGKPIFPPHASRWRHGRQGAGAEPRRPGPRRTYRGGKRAMTPGPLLWTPLLCIIPCTPGDAEEPMRKPENEDTWVVYLMTVHGSRGGSNAVCEQGEWDEMERARP